MDRRIAIVSLVTVAGCTNAQISIPQLNLEEVIDNEVSVHGSVCAETAEELESFLKIMLIIDRSNSMENTDPGPGSLRMTKSGEMLMQFIDNPATLQLRAGVEVALITFWGGVETHTRNRFGLPGFTDDGFSVITSLVQAEDTSPNTGYDKALAVAYQVLDVDMARLRDAARPRSRYEIFFISDGTPHPDDCIGEANSLPAAVNSVRRIKGLEILYNVPIRFHTAFTSVPGMFVAPMAEADRCCLGVARSPISLVASCRIEYCAVNADCLAGQCEQAVGQCNPISGGEVVRKLLQEMATAGGGTFKQLSVGDSLTLFDFEFTDSRRFYALSSFVVSNLNARPDFDHVIPDSDADGLSDAEEHDLGTSPYDLDSDGDGYRDGIEVRYRLSGFDPLDPTDANCSGVGRGDRDFDQLLDCEEELIAAVMRVSYDTDADGIPDFVEFQARGDANSATPLQDHQTDSDADGGSNADEMRWHTDIHADDVAERAGMAYRYNLVEQPILTGQACYDFDVDNIKLASTRGKPADRSPTGVAEQDGWNRIMLYFAETPYDDPLGDPIYRVACVEGRHIEERDLKIPANGRFDIPPRRASDSHRPSPVLGPNESRCYVSNNEDCGLQAKWCHFEDDGSGCSCCDPPPNFPCSIDAHCPAGRICIVASGVCEVFPDESNGVNCGQPCPQCSDGEDNDGDGFTDFPYDPDCFNPLDPDESDGPQCSNGIDDDADGPDGTGDGLVDWPFDPGCTDAYDLTEDDPPTMPQCADGIDNDIMGDGGGAIDFPDDAGCYAASDQLENLNINSPFSACSDGVDNDGDGLIDYFDGDGDGFVDPPGDPGCSSPEDIDEAGPAICFYCERTVDALPGQCDARSGFCRAIRGSVPGRGAPCTSSADCRGLCDPAIGQCVLTGAACAGDGDCTGVCDLTDNRCDALPCASDLHCRGSRCDTSTGICVRCIIDEDCDSAPGAGDGICQRRGGWCLEATYGVTPEPCTTDANCAAGTCQIDIGYCSVDPYHGCRDDDVCLPGHICSQERGFCIERVFSTAQCGPERPCAEGTCDAASGWCHPDEPTTRCLHDDLCPQGSCTASGACDQDTFVFPKDFRPEIDCLREN